MTLQAAISLGVEVRVLATTADESAALVAHHVTLGSPTSTDDVAALAAGCAVVTFDHEQVDPASLRELEAAGIVLRPSAATLSAIVDKREQRALLTSWGLPAPRHTTAATTDEMVTLGGEWGWPLVLKAGRGGYDGRGVWVVDDDVAAAAVLRQVGEAVLVEEYLRIEHELAVLGVRGVDGELRCYPVVETIQDDGICRAVIAPAPLDDALLAQAVRLATLAASRLDVVGIFAVELFLVDGDRLLVNEVSTRPHNTGHFSIATTATSQFENHVRAVLGLPLGDPSLLTGSAVMVNIIGADPVVDPRSQLAAALTVPGAQVHLYDKEPRSGRKLGHVTVAGPDTAANEVAAWAAVDALGAKGRPGT
jgi:5-(carboxyamino)imidazole ribonucleotide synthase